MNTAKLLLLLITLIASTLPAVSEELPQPLLLSPKSEKINLGKYLEVYNDPKGLLTITDVSSPEFQKNFKRNTIDGLSISLNKRNTWVKFSILNKNEKEEWLLELGRDRYQAKIFSAPPNGISEKKQEEKKCAPSKVNFKNTTYKICLPREEVTTFYISFKTYGLERIPFDLWSVDSFREHSMEDFILFGMLYGIFFSMILYNLFLYFALRTKIYLIYVLYLSSFLIFYLLFNGHLNLFFHLSTRTSLAIEFFFLGCGAFFTITFCRLFFDTPVYTPRLNTTLYAIQLTSIGVLILGVLGFTPEADLLMNITSCGTLPLLIIGAIRLRQGFKPARYYIIANLFYFSGVLSILFWFWLENIFPLAFPGDLFFTMGPAAEAILLSFALAYQIRSLEQEKKTLLNQHNYYKKASELDGLTGLYNKKFFLETLGTELQKNEDKDLILLLIDVDNFKQLNDSYGHPQGDAVLKHLARELVAHTRGSDYACRYGGEEFTVILPNTTACAGKEIAERIRIAFAKKRATQPEEMKTNISVGIAQHKKDEAPAQLIERADRALYRAKRTGKNRSILAE